MHTLSHIDKLAAGGNKLQMSIMPHLIKHFETKHTEKFSA